MKLIDVVTVAVILVIVGINLYKMAQNLKNGRSIDGCDGDCSHCRAAKKAKVHKKEGC